MRKLVYIMSGRRVQTLLGGWRPWGAALELGLQHDFDSSDLYKSAVEAAVVQELELLEKKTLLHAQGVSIWGLSEQGLWLCLC